MSKKFYDKLRAYCQEIDKKHGKMEVVFAENFKGKMTMLLTRRAEQIKLMNNWKVIKQNAPVRPTAEVSIYFDDSYYTYSDVNRGVRTRLRNEIDLINEQFVFLDYLKDILKRKRVISGVYIKVCFLDENVLDWEHDGSLIIEDPMDDETTLADVQEEIERLQTGLELIREKAVNEVKDLVKDNTERLNELKEEKKEGILDNIFVTEFEKEFFLSVIHDEYKEGLPCRIQRLKERNPNDEKLYFVNEDYFKMDFFGSDGLVKGTIPKDELEKIWDECREQASESKITILPINSQNVKGMLKFNPPDVMFGLNVFKEDKEE